MIKTLLASYLTIAGLTLAAGPRAAEPAEPAAAAGSLAEVWFGDKGKLTFVGKGDAAVITNHGEDPGLASIYDLRLSGEGHYLVGELGLVSTDRVSGDGGRLGQRGLGGGRQRASSGRLR